jgi:class 3 adenylate cyclase/tetratricopeptide (TPR) repeat protein
MPDSAVNQCTKCGFQNGSRAGFCVSCGESLSERCPQCRAPVVLQQKFCGECGRMLAGASTDSSRVQTPRHLAERVQSAFPPGEAERKIATVLFADIASSTALIGDRDAEDAWRILKPTVDIMVKIVHRYEGITRVEGDGIMASFGAPLALEDHAVRACYAALDMQEAMRSHAAKVRREFGMLFQVRIGINSGPVVVTVNHQEGDFIDFRVDGIPTHVTKRLESLATPGTILLTRDTLALAQGFVQVSSIGLVPLRGIAGQVEVYELHGVNTRARIHALAARGLSKFVGRQDEIERLGRAAAQAQSGHGQVVALVGEAGVGKSRIFLEFARSSHMQRWLMLEAASVSYGKATSYLPLVDLLTRYFEIKSRDDERQVRETIFGKLFALGDEKLLAQLPLFVGALGMGVTDDAWMNMTPAERQSQMFDALRRLLICEAQRQPLCLVFEDLHWVDAETQTFLDLLLESIPAARVLVLVNYRPEYETRWAAKSYFSHVRIDPLPEASADQLLEVLLGSHAELGPIRQRLIEATEGNPLFLEESVRSLIESEALDQSSGQWRLVKPLPADFVPRTIEALLASRIDRLRPDLKEILQCAAVIGGDIRHSLLEAVTGLAQSDLGRCVRDLQAAEFLFEKSLLPETEYAFKHSMTREVAYASLLRERKMELHALAARALEVLAAGRLDEHIERLADHAERGGIWDKAVEYLQASGAKAYSLYANLDAVGFFERALKVLRQLPETRTTLEQAVDIRFELRNALLPLGEIDRILASLEEIEPGLTALGDKLRSARHAAFRCNHHFLVGEQRRAIEYGEVGLRLAREHGDRIVEGELLYRLAQSYNALGEYRPAIALLEQSLECTTNQRGRHRFDLTVIPAVVNRTWLVNALVECGDFAAGMSHAKRALEIAEGAEHPLSQVLGWLSVGHLLLRKGELEGAVGALERGLDLCDRWSLRVWRPRVASTLGVAYARSGRPSEGLQLAQQAVADAERMRLTVDKAGLRVRLGQASLIAGRTDEALTLGKQAVEIAVAHAAKGDEAWARFLIARTCWASDPPDLDESAKQLDLALGLATACEARPLVAFCQTTFGGIHARRGDTASAVKFNTAAAASYKELGMAPLPLDPVR